MDSSSQIVPKEPTEEMLKAGLAFLHIDEHEPSLLGAYRAMLAAAPEQQGLSDYVAVSDMDILGRMNSALRVVTWSEMTPEQRMEAMRREVRDLRVAVTELQSIVRKLKVHQYAQDGSPALVNPGVVCHAPGERCLGCDHYHHKAPVCKYAAPAAPAPRVDAAAFAGNTVVRYTASHMELTPETVRGCRLRPPA